MIVTNRDLNALRNGLDRELFRLQVLKSMPNRRSERERIERQIGLLSRRRVMICAAAVNRHIEASRPIVSLARWASGNGVLDDVPGVDWPSVASRSRLPQHKVADPLGHALPQIREEK